MRQQGLIRSSSSHSCLLGGQNRTKTRKESKDCSSRTPCHGPWVVWTCSITCCYEKKPCVCTNLHKPVTYQYCQLTHQFQIELPITCIQYTMPCNNGILTSIVTLTAETHPCAPFSSSTTLPSTCLLATAKPEIWACVWSAKMTATVAWMNTAASIRSSLSLFGALTSTACSRANSRTLTSARWSVGWKSSSNRLRISRSVQNA
jgi:hypothetical protein